MNIQSLLNLSGNLLLQQVSQKILTLNREMQEKGKVIFNCLEAPIMKAVPKLNRR